MGSLIGRSLSLLCLSACIAGCSNPALKNLTSTILAQTGYVNESQVDGVFNAGEGLVKSQTALTTEQEYYLGRAVSAKLLATFPPSSQSSLLSYVNKVGGAVAGVSDVPETFGGYHFVIVESSQINAMSAPGGYVFVSSGFLKLLPDEDSLAAVLAHEVAHVVKRHGVNAISNGALFSALGEFTKASASIAVSNTGSSLPLSEITDVFGDSVSGITDKLLTSGFDRSQEYEADLYAANLLVKAGYNPSALVKVLEILKQHTSSDESGWYATHPHPEDRIDELEDEMKFNTALYDTPAARKTRFASAVR
jgi:predicted Zn-dependent protease